MLCAGACVCQESGTGRAWTTDKNRGAPTGKRREDERGAVSDGVGVHEEEQGRGSDHGVPRSLGEAGEDLRVDRSRDREEGHAVWWSGAEPGVLRF
jgi:hypothetical protein